MPAVSVASLATAMRVLTLALNRTGLIHTALEWVVLELTRQALRATKTKDEASAGKTSIFQTEVDAVTRPKVNGEQKHGAGEPPLFRGMGETAATTVASSASSTVPGVVNNLEFGDGGGTA